MVPPRATISRRPEEIALEYEAVWSTATVIKMVYCGVLKVVQDVAEAVAKARAVVQLRRRQTVHGHRRCGSFPSDAGICRQLRDVFQPFIAVSLQPPHRCQLVIVVPDGRPDEKAHGERRDGRMQLDYHIEGGGKIPKVQVRGP